MKKTSLQESKEFDVFLSHNWGDDTKGRNNKQRVHRIYEELKRNGVKPWYDEYEMDGNILDCMAKGIGESNKAIVFVTEEYIRKAEDEANPLGKRDNCYREFNYIVGHKDPKDIIPVAMEDSVRDPSKWNGPLGMSLAGSVYIDCSSDFMISNCVQELRKRIFDIDSKGGIGEKKFKDGTYTGALNAQGQRHGRGRMKYRNKSTYEGMFVNDKREDPHGVIVYPNGVKFVGCFKNDQRKPTGTLILENGSMEGRFLGSNKVGRFDGQEVTFTDNRGNRYVGDIKANQLGGYGKMVYANGSVYIGAFKIGQRFGRGEIKHKNGDWYSGDWEYDQKHGEGKSDFANKDRYTGGYHRGLLHGKGVYISSKGSFYEGEFENNKRNGFGKLVSLDRRVTRGQWNDGKLHGMGYREYRNGDKYKGYFNMNCRHGEGEMLFSSGAHYKGQWRNSEMCHGLLDFDEVKKTRKKYGFQIRKVPTLFAVEFDSEGLVEASPIFSSARSIKKTGTLKDTFEHGARTEYYAALQAKDLAKKSNGNMVRFSSDASTVSGHTSITSQSLAPLPVEVLTPVKTKQISSPPSSGSVYLTPPDSGDSGGTYLTPAESAPDSRNIPRNIEETAGKILFVEVDA